MKIVLLSDLHGFLPEIDKNGIDYMFLCGDICPDYIIPQQWYWYDEYFVPWLNECPPTMFIPGNHDFLFERRIPEEDTFVQNGLHRLPDGQVVYAFGYTICPRWAFHKTDEQIKSLLTKTDDFDMMVSHNPPVGICDRARPSFHHSGSTSIRELVDRAKPRVHIFGHIHEGYGSKYVGDTLFINCAFRDEAGKPRKQYLVLDTDDLSIDVLPCKEFV